MKKLSVFSLILSTIMLFSCKGTNQDAPQEVIDTVPPNITEKGIEPFVLGASLYDIPVKGSFYDTIILEKLYDWAENRVFDEGCCYGERVSEQEYKRMYDKYNGNIRVTKNYGVAKIVKDEDTLIMVDYNDTATITSIIVRSGVFQTENGIHTGMGSLDLINNYNAKFVTQNVWGDGSSSLSDNLIINIPSLPKNIIVFSDLTNEIKKFMYEKEKESGNNYDFDFNCELPSELVRKNSITKIKIRDSDFDCYYKYYKEF